MSPFPARRCRSTGGHRLQHDNRYLARLGSALIVVIRRIDLLHLRPELGALGAGRVRVIFRHLLPNVAGQLAVATALGVGEAMLLEAGLSFLGAGVRPPTPSWGSMIHDGKDVLLTAPWATLAPGIALTCAVLAANRIGDAVRDAFDPRTR